MAKIHFLEKDLEEILHSTDQNILADKGLTTCPHDILLRQVNLGKYGIADLVGINFYDDYNSITVYELKLNEVNAGTLLQALSYCKGLDKVTKLVGREKPLHFNMVLIGKTICTKGAFCYIPDYLNVKFYTYHLDINGLHFEAQSGYQLNDPAIPESTIAIFSGIGQEQTESINLSTDLPF